GQTRCRDAGALVAYGCSRVPNALLLVNAYLRRLRPRFAPHPSAGGSWRCSPRGGRSTASFMYVPSELTLEILSDCQTVGHVNGIPCSIIAPNALPATEPT